jgi:molybdate transport system ATP-binding protein
VTTAGLEAHVVVRRETFTLDVEVPVPAGEIVAVLGPNGAGKSTLLRALAGLVPLDDGHVRLDGVVLDDPHLDVLVPPQQRRVGLVFQDYRLFPHLSVLDNVAFGPRVTGRSRRDSENAAREWLVRLGIDEFAERRPGEISGGQAQRAALARALASDPALLLLDEPLAALDAGTRIDVRADLRRHLSGFAGPVVLVTHDALDALTLADRLVVLENGSVTQAGPVREVVRRPATDYVARLVGLNLLRGVAHSGDVLLDEGGLLHVPDHELSGAVLVALRPSAIAVHVGPPEGSPRNVWAGVVGGVEPVGDRVRVTVEGEPTVTVDLTPEAVQALDVRPGERVWLSAKATELEVYPG